MRSKQGPKVEPSVVGEGRRNQRSVRFYFVLLVVLAAVLRIAYTLSSRSSPFFAHLDLDTKFYDGWARQIAAGDWVGDEVFFMGPLYPYFLALAYKAFGPSLLAAKLVQSLVGSLTAGFAFLLGRECFGSWVGLIAGLLAAVYVPFIFTDTLLLFPVLATLLNVIMLYFLCRGLKRSATRALFASGVFAGLSAAGNASVLAFAPLAAGLIVFHRGWGVGQSVRKAALFALGIAVVVLPIMARNYAVGKDIVPLTSNAGLNFYIGNSAHATGAYVKPEGLDIYTDPSGRSIAERALGRSLKPSEVSRYWSGRAGAYIRSDPGGFARNLLRKFFFFWSVYEIPQIEHLPFERQYSWLLRLPTPSFGIVGPLGIVGMVLALRRRREALPLALFILAYSLSIIAFFVVARYRLPMVPVLLVFAAYFIVWLISQGAGGRWRPAAYSLIAWLCLFVVVHINFYRIHPLNGFAQSYYRLGVIHEGKGDLAGALANYSKALEIDPSIVQAQVNVGILLSRQARYQEAKEHLACAVRLDPDYDKAFYNLGLVYAEAGTNDSALVMFGRALEINPDYGLAKVARAAALYELGDLAAAGPEIANLVSDPEISEQARAQMAHLLALVPDRQAWMQGRRSEQEAISDRLLLRGDNLASLGLGARAMEAYGRAVAADPASSAARFEMGSLYLRRGDLASAEREFQRLLETSPSYKGAHLSLGTIALGRNDPTRACREFSEELRIDPGSSAAHLSLALCYEQRFRDFGNAAEHLRRYNELTGGTPQTREHLKQLEEMANERL
jgi:tetratricopeptide (TPR) repeat protein